MGSPPLLTPAITVAESLHENLGPLHDYVAMRPLLPPLLDPQVKYIVEIYVRQ